MLDLSQLLQVPHVDPAFDISPDGSRIAFSWNKQPVAQASAPDLDELRL